MGGRAAVSGRFDPQAAEERTQVIGRELFALARQEHARLSTINQWTHQILSWCLSDLAVKSAVLRFIDVLPSLTTPQAIAHHLQEYFPTSTARLPVTLRVGSSLAHSGLLTTRAFSTLVIHAVERVARQFIAESTPVASRRVIQQLATAGVACSVDVLGEQVLSEMEADRYVTQCEQLLSVTATTYQTMAHPPASVCGPLINLSVKPSALTPRYDPISPQDSVQRASKRLRRLLDAAHLHGALINLDMEQYELRDLTLLLAKDLMQADPSLPVGIVIQAYLCDAQQVTDAVLRWARPQQHPLTVRLVKGAYWDAEIVSARQRHWPLPVYQEKAATEWAFERLTERLLNAAPVITTAIASHNVRSIAHAMAVAELLGLSRHQLEFQLLYGMGEAIRTAIVAMGYPVRIYTPVGELVPGMAYLVRRLLENTANESFLRQDFLHERSVEDLLAPPLSGASGEGWAERGVSQAERARCPAGGDALRSLPLRQQPPCSNSSPSGLATARGGEGVAAAATTPPQAGGTSEAGEPSERSHAGAERRVRASAQPRAQLAEDMEWTGEPLADFSKEDARDQMQEALHTVRAQFGKTYAVPWLHATHAADPLVSRNPAKTNDVLGIIPQGTRASVDEAVQRAVAAHAEWARRSVKERTQPVRQAAQLMRTRRAELAAWMVCEVGKTWREADIEVVEAIEYLEYYSAEMERLMRAGTLMQLPGEHNHYAYGARGVTAVIAPWNFPLAILMGMTSAALVSGNAVIMKPAEQSSLIAYHVAQLLYRAGIPESVVQYLPGRGEEVGAALVAHPAIAQILFTGSRAVGLSILEAASRVPKGHHVIKRVIVEMGGKNAIIIDEDADLDAAVAGTLLSAFGYAGQKCSAASRVIVHDAVYDRYLSRLIAATDRLVIGDPANPATDVGPLIDQTARQRLHEAVDHARDVATIAYAYPTARLPIDGSFVGPTLVTDVSSDDPLAREELFGPLLCVFRARNFDEALVLANDSDYALTGGVYARSPSHIEQAVQEFDVGNLYINRPITGAMVGRQPFGGHKLSGLGTKAGGPDYLTHLTVPKTICRNTTRHGMPLE